mmetsp:Transcript_40040/g.113219  ORF Transcript_40040/g.113219 Transcript_40040/m.113219 type:complete len:1162 (+) Transcript_40040:10-3495(+)
MRARAAPPGILTAGAADGQGMRDFKRAPDEGAAPRQKLAGQQQSVKIGMLSLSTLGHAISQQNLQVLNLKDNKISGISAEVFNAFPRIKTLDLRKNHLEELSADIAAMLALEELLVDQNRLRDIPPEACRLPNMKTLSAGQNALRAIPRAVGEMTRLQSLVVSDNSIDELPAELGACATLQTLHLHHNSFTRLPSTLGQLENLSEFSLEWFRYTTPPLPRIVKGAEWKRLHVQLTDVCKEHWMDGQGCVGCIEVLSRFSQKGFDLNALDSKHRTRLHVACLEGHVGVAMALAQGGCKCDMLDREGCSPLLIAVREEYSTIATALVRTGGDVNRGGGLFGSPLHVATVNFDPQLVLLLIHGKADVNLTDGDGNTPLHVLMSVFDRGGKRADTVGQILLRQSADCNMMNDDKWAPLHLAARRGQLRGIRFVLRQIESADEECRRGACSHHPTHSKSRSSQACLCARTFGLNVKGGSHLWTSLHLAGHAGHVPVVQALIQGSADIFLQNIDCHTPRHISRGNMAISKLLRKAEDEFLWYQVHGESPLGGGAEAGCGAGEDADFREPSGALASAAAAETGREDTLTANNSRVAGAARTSGGAPLPRPRDHKLIDKSCQNLLTTQLEAAYYVTPANTVEEALCLFNRVLQPGATHQALLLLSRPWVSDWVPELLGVQSFCNKLLQPRLMANEDLVRLLVCKLPRDKLPLLGKIRNDEEASVLHVLCGGGAPAGAPPSPAPRADVLSFLLTVCPPGTFHLEAEDARGQRALHLAARSGGASLVRVLLGSGAGPNAREATTGWTPLHFAVAAGHCAVVMQLLYHDATDVNRADQFDWPPLLEACSRLDVRSTSLLVNAGAKLAYRSQHDYDALKAIDTSKKDLAAKKWMSCLVVSNGFRIDQSSMQLGPEDRDILRHEEGLYDCRVTPASCPPFYVPDHLAPRCHNCKVLFSVGVRRHRCRSCGLVLCGDCTKWRAADIQALDQRARGRREAPEPRAAVVQLGGGRGRAVLNSSRIDMAVEIMLKEQGVTPVPPGIAAAASAATSTATPPGSTVPEAAEAPAAGAGRAAEAAAPGAADDGDAIEVQSPRESEDSFENLPLAEELPVSELPPSVICPASMMAAESRQAAKEPAVKLRCAAAPPGGSAQAVQLCASCADFFGGAAGKMPA